MCSGEEREQLVVAVCMAGGKGRAESQVFQSKYAIPICKS